MARTKEEIKVWREKMQTLSKKIKAMPDAEKMKLFDSIGTITPAGHKLSVYNTISLYYQAGRALNQVGGFKQWQKFNRRVIKGQKSIGSILVPIQVDAEEIDGKSTNDLKFIAVSVFDISQTEIIKVESCN